MDSLVGILPIALVLICPLIMILMMRGMHGGHRGKSASTDGSSDGRMAELEQPVRELRDERDRGREKAA